MRIIKTKAMIMKEYTVRESDKFITVFTKSNGKLMVNAPYAKKHNRGFASGTQLFVYADLVLQEFKASHKLLQIDIIEAFNPLRMDLLKLGYASYMLELIDKTMEIYLSSPDTLRLMVRTLQAMCKDAMGPNLIIHTFELKHMCMIGFMPNLFECNGCGRSYQECQPLYFDITQGGIVCKDCSLPNPYCYLISQSTLYTMQHIASVHIDDLFTFIVSNKVLFELNQITRAYIAYYIDKSFKTLKFIEDLNL